jgi:hypothetical protein
MMAEEIEDAEYKNRQGQEDLSSEETGPRLNSPGYPALLEELKTRIRSAQLRASLTLNQEAIRLYWSSDRTSPPALRRSGGELRSWIGWPRISARSFPGWRVSASATFATCVPSPRRGPTRKYCSLLQNCPGVIT